MTDQEVRDAIRQLMADWDALPQDVREAAQAEAKRRADEAEAFVVQCNVVARRDRASMARRLAAGF